VYEVDTQATKPGPEVNAQCVVVLPRAIVVWLVILLAEVLHGMARAFLLEPRVGDFMARQIAVLTGSVMILIIAILFIRWMRASSLFELLGVGSIWVILMLGFEIGMGRLVMGYSWERIVSDYNLAEGGLLLIGMLILGLSPLIAAKLRAARG
jgi:hypothetical protein